MMRESMYIDEYLAETSGGHLVTPGTYLHGQLTGKARDYARGYLRALEAALARRVDAGTVEPVPSVGGSIAYVRT